MAKGLLARYEKNPASAVDVLIAENMRSAASFLREEFLKRLPPAFPLDSFLHSQFSIFQSVIPPFFLLNVTPTFTIFLPLAE